MLSTNLSFRTHILCYNKFNRLSIYRLILTKEGLLLHMLKGKIFRRLIFIFSCISIVSITALAFFIYKTNERNTWTNAMEENQKIMTNLAFYLDQNILETENNLKDFYNDASLNRHLNYLLNSSLKDYLTFNMTEFTESLSTSSNGLDLYLEKCLFENEYLAMIDLYSLPKDFTLRASVKGFETLDRETTTHIKSDLPSKENLGYFSTTSITLYPYKQKDLFSIRYPVYDYFTLELMGFIFFRYRMDFIDDFLSTYQGANQGIISITNNQNQKLYISHRSVKSISYDLTHSTPTMNLTRAKNTLLYATLPMGYVKEHTQSFNRLLLLITSVLIFFIVLLSYLATSNFQKRIDLIISAFKKVQSGDLTIRLKVPKKQDELSIIAEQFNQMCLDLDLYIKKFYLAELKQKDTQFLALQRQINPHFLANNLEAIRMKALTGGDRDVAEMIYILSTLYRRSIKSPTIIELEDEIDYCEMYLSLFKIRYGELFDFSIQITEEIYDASIVSLALQPILENYILHGLKTDGTLNHLTIIGEKIGETLRIIISDNGYGMEEETLDQVNNRLQDPHANKWQSIGLTNIQERIQMMFGPPYGLRVESHLNEGTKVILEIPYRPHLDFTTTDAIR